MEGMSTRHPYPSAVSDDEWALVAPYLTLLPEDVLQCKHDLRQVFNALRWLGRTGAPWRMLPHDFPRWEMVYQQTQRWLRAGCFEALAHDLRLLARLAQGRRGQPSAVVIDSRTLQSSPESGARAGYDGAKRRKGSKVHLVVDTLGHLLTLVVTPANAQDRAQVGELAAAVQALTGETVELAYVDQGDTGPRRGRPQPSGASNLRSSNSPTPSAASSSSHAAGSSSAVLPGWRAFGAWPETTSACPRPSLA